MIQLKNDIIITLATAKGARSTNWKSKRETWEDLVNRLSKAHYTDETVSEYAAMSKDEQGRIKDVGAFVGGYIKGGRRLKGSIVHRQLIALDIDFAFDGMLKKIHALRVAYVVYSTHKHTPDDPRYRLLVPVSRELSPDEYEAAARVLAWKVDPTLNAFDDTTFQPERCMFYQSTPKDGEYVFKYGDFEIADPDDLLSELIDWQDPTTWYYSDRVEEVRTHERRELAEDPTTKHGVIGAFCRAFDMDEAITEFLSDVYEDAPLFGKNRYTYLAGTTGGGLIVYDDVFAFAHQSTDPANNGRLLNAFDLVRIHKFGDKDADFTGNPDEPTRLPSYKAMADWAATLPEVKRQMIDDRKRASASDYDDPVGVEVPDDWIDHLEADKNGIRGTKSNCVDILNLDPDVSGVFAYNIFDSREVALRRTPWDRKGLTYPRPLRDVDDDELLLWFEQKYGITRENNIKSALNTVTHRNAFNPVIDYLDACEWDGVERLDTLLIDLFGADDTEYTRAVTRKTLVAAVARAYDAPVKFDYALTIVGEQGTGKSSTIARLANGWFSDSLTSMGDKESYEGVQGAWIIELAELASIRRSALEGMKNFITKVEDRFRQAYGRRIETHPRRCIFIATTNESDFLQDTTGNRRFWVVDTIGRRGTEKWNEYLTPAVVSQIWGEAKQRYREKELLYLTGDLADEATKIQTAHLETDDRTGLVIKYLDTLLPEDWDEYDIANRRAYLEDPEAIEARGVVRRTRVCVMEIWCECYRQDPAKIEYKDRKPIVRMMRAMRGWQSLNKTINLKLYNHQKMYQRL